MLNRIIKLSFVLCAFQFARAQPPGIEWQKCFGGSDYDSFGSVVCLSNGDYVVNGNTASNDFDVSGNHGDNDIWLVKFSSQGNLLSKKCLGGTNTDACNCI